MTAILFAHTHKCAGTSMIKLFRSQEFISAPPQPAALPPYFFAAKELDDLAIARREFGAKGFESFWRYARRQGWNFVATEWIVPPVESLDLDLFTFTVLRDPFQRYLSNYHFDVRRGFTKAESLWEYRDYRTFRKYNYFTRFFAGRPNNHDDQPLTEADLATAKARLSAFSAVLVLEQPESLRQLTRVGIDPDRLRNEKAHGGAKSYPEDFREHFMARAGFDYELYEHAADLARRATEDPGPPVKLSAVPWRRKLRRALKR
ncbi:MAG: sulfotransferase family 2 domain-containing protein [Actinobacteria bacterium]|nr:sulfotransferase family 2 domain-containing protein [Actinomycetota bacterium]